MAVYDVGFTWQLRTLAVMNSGSSRSGLLVVIALSMVLMVIVALAAVWAGDVTERVEGLLTTVFAAIAEILTGLLFVLRLESVKATVENVDRKTDTAAVAARAAAQTAAAAARKTEVVEQKVESVRHDIHNDVLIQKVLAAIKQAEEDPEIQELRIETTAKGVQHDRHETASREQAAYARGVADAMKRRRGLRGGEGS